MPSPAIAVLIPCYNTSAACADVIREAAALSPWVLAVDDGSTDDTAAHLGAGRCRVLSLPSNQGKGAALHAGFRAILDEPDGQWPAMDFVLTMDGDGQHDPADIPRFLEAAGSSGADLVIGVRRPRAMPRKNRVGSHFSRLLFLIGTNTFVADTQSGYRLYSRPLLRALMDRVTWRGYETESEALWQAIELGFKVVAVPIATIYADGNRGSQFSPWRDSTRIAAVFTRQIRWTVGMAWLDLVLFTGIVLAGAMSPGSANVTSRALAVACQALFRRDYVPRTRRLIEAEGAGWCALALAGHLAATTLLVVGLVRLGVDPVPAKALAQLAGYLASFAVVDRVLLARAVAAQELRTERGQ